MWYLLYNSLLVLALPVIVAVLLAKKRCRRGLSQRLGWVLPPPDGAQSQVVWIHAVSLGEAVAIVPLVRALRSRYPGYRMMVSTVTETGREIVETQLASVAEHFYAPLDFPWVVSRVVARLAPRLFVLVETELWPNLLRALDRQGIAAILINGRLSSDSFRRYAAVRPFMRRVLSSLRWCLMQSARDVERMVALGADPARVLRAGNVKFDQSVPQLVDADKGVTRRELGIEESEDVLVAGSTHPGEEDAILEAYGTLSREHPRLVLVVAPRHIERAHELEMSVRVRGLAVRRRSEMAAGGTRDNEPTGPRVVILDTRGELVSVYRHAAVSYVGGTLVPVGGHNLLEPALWSKPVFFGPHTDHCEEIAELLLAAGGGVRVRDSGDLAVQVGMVLRNPAMRQRIGASAQQVVADNRGALQHCLDVIERLLHPVPSPSDRSATGHDRQGRQADKPAPDSQGAWRERILGIPAVRTCLYPFAFAYGLGVRVRGWLYGRGLFGTHRLPCPVISVGNLTVGGTGKTPVVIFLVHWLLAHGQRVGVLSRGYRRHKHGPMALVSDGHQVLLSPDEAGDEPFLIARRCPGAVVAVGDDRHRLGAWLLDQMALDCLVLDDGFQHRRLARNLDLLLVDASDQQGLDALLPIGRLREPLTAAARASAIVLTRVEEAHGLETVMKRFEAAHVPIHDPIGLRFVASGAVTLTRGEIEPIRRLSGQRAVLCSGVARPESFRRLVEGLDVKVLDTIVWPDHHAYSRADLGRILERAMRLGADMVLTTEKDAVKLEPLLRGSKVNCPFWAVRLGVDIISGRDHLDRLLQQALNR